MTETDFAALRETRAHLVGQIRATYPAASALLTQIESINDAIEGKLEKLRIEGGAIARSIRANLALVKFLEKRGTPMKARELCKAVHQEGYQADEDEALVVARLLKAIKRYSGENKPPKERKFKTINNMVGLYRWPNQWFESDGIRVDPVLSAKNLKKKPR